jgi:hypothetical protein
VWVPVPTMIFSLTGELGPTEMFIALGELLVLLFGPSTTNPKVELEMPPIPVFARGLLLNAPGIPVALVDRESRGDTPGET